MRCTGKSRRKTDRRRGGSKKDETSFTKKGWRKNHIDHSSPPKVLPASQLLPHRHSANFTTCRPDSHTQPNAPRFTASGVQNTSSGL